MWGREQQDEQLEEFIAARTQDLHHDAFQLTASQESAERLVVAVLADLRRQRVDLSRAGATAHLRMVQRAATDDRPTALTDDQSPAARFLPIARLSPRQRAVLLLQVVAGYDDRSISRALQLSSRTVKETVRSIPYDDLLSPPSRPNELRSLLEAFGDLATFPDAATTMRQVHTAKTTARRPWWTYVAALLVIAMTATTFVVTGRWHDDWLRTPDGLNHAHGTHFPTYIQGYQLADIRDMTPGIAQDVTTGPAGAVALPCDVVGPMVRLSVQSNASSDTVGDSCLEPGPRTRLIDVEGRASAMVLGRTRDEFPVGLYRQVPLSEYPIATKDFNVQHDLTLDMLRGEAASDKRPQDASERVVLTLRGTKSHHNGTFKGRLLLPPSKGDGPPPEAQVVALLSPTTTGRFRVRIDGVPPGTSCGRHSTLTDRQPKIPECVLVDHQVPQVTYFRPVAGIDNWLPVEVTVKDAHGPWTLQVVAVAYEDGSTG
ncbi:hypothetical protein [Flexivirga sp. B27]